MKLNWNCEQKRIRKDAMVEEPEKRLRQLESGNVDEFSNKVWSLRVSKNEAAGKNDPQYSLNLYAFKRYQGNGPGTTLRTLPELFSRNISLSLSNQFYLLVCHSFDHFLRSLFAFKQIYNFWHPRASWIGAVSVGCNRWPGRSFTWPWDSTRWCRSSSRNSEN